MEAWQNLLVQDFDALGNRITLLDFAFWFQVGFWLMLLAVPLSGIDRRDTICSYNYILYLMVAISLLFFALPGQAQSWSNWSEHLLTFLFFGLIGLFRWHFQGKKRAKLTAVKQNNEDQNFIKEIER